MIRREWKIGNIAYMSRSGVFVSKGDRLKVVRIDCNGTPRFCNDGCHSAAEPLRILTPEEQDELAKKPLPKGMRLVCISYKPLMDKTVREGYTTIASSGMGIEYAILTLPDKVPAPLPLAEFSAEELADEVMRRLEEREV